MALGFPSPVDGPIRASSAQGLAIHSRIWDASVVQLWGVLANPSFSSRGANAGGLPVNGDSEQVQVWRYLSSGIMCPRKILASARRWWYLESRDTYISAMCCVHPLKSTMVSSPVVRRRCRMEAACTTYLYQQFANGCRAPKRQKALRQPSCLSHPFIILSVAASDTAASASTKWRHGIKRPAAKVNTEQSPRTLGSLSTG